MNSVKLSLHDNFISKRLDFTEYTVDRSQCNHLGNGKEEKNYLRLVKAEENSHKGLKVFKL